MSNQTKQSITTDIDSELPFSLKDNGHNINIKDAKGSVICVIYEMAEAKYIQKACNLFPELVGMLENTFEKFERGEGHLIDSNGQFYSLCPNHIYLMKEIKELIQKAKQ